MEIINLAAQKREIKGKKVKTLRDQGKVPAVLYGHGLKNIDLVIDQVAMDKVFKQAGESTLIDLSIDNQAPVKVLIQGAQLNNLSNRLTHLDFHQVRMDEKINTEIDLNFVGEALAVKNYGGIMVTNVHSLKVECLPTDLVHEIEVDLSSLKELDAAIHVSDLKLPKGISTAHNLSDVVVMIQPPRTEKEMASLEEKPEAVLPEAVIEAPAAEASEK